MGRIQLLWFHEWNLSDHRIFVGKNKTVGTWVSEARSAQPRMKFSVFSCLARVLLSSVGLGWRFPRSNQHHHRQQQQQETLQICILPSTHHRHAGWNWMQFPNALSGKFRKCEKVKKIQVHSGLPSLTVGDGLGEYNVQWVMKVMSPCHLAWIWNYKEVQEEAPIPRLWAQTEEGNI